MLIFNKLFYAEEGVCFINLKKEIPMKRYRNLLLFMAGLFLLVQGMFASNWVWNSPIKKSEEKGEKSAPVVTSEKLLKLSGYTQVRYRMRDDNIDTFDIRRARLTLKGDITKRFGYKLQCEFGGTQQKLLDAELSYTFNPNFKLSAGQFKIPLSQENLTSSAKLDTINRSQVVEALIARSKDVIGNQNGRDIGVKVSGRFLPASNKPLFDYEFGIFNGSGINTSDRDEHKDFAGRIVFHPVNGLLLGGAFYAGKYTLPNAQAEVEEKDARNRIGAEFSYVRDSMSIKGEYIKGTDWATNKDGWYIQGGYFFIPKKLQGILKYDIFDPDKDKPENSSRIFTVGINWNINGAARLQACYELKDEEGKEKNSNYLIIQMQLGF